MVFPAHLRTDPDGTRRVQTVEEHCRKSAQDASHCIGPHLAKAAYLAGLLHDMGKFTRAFRQYILAAAAGEAVRRGSVNHTFAGARWILERWHHPECFDKMRGQRQRYRPLTAEILAAAVAAHHGLFDGIDPNGMDGFVYRIEKDGIDYEEAKNNFLDKCADTEELDSLFDAAVEEVADVLERCRRLANHLDEQMLYVSMLTRQILSAVIQGDRENTAAFMKGTQEEWEPDESEAWENRLAAVEARLDALPRQSEIDRARRAISQRCREAADGQAGIFRLTVPTGGGKTLATLRFALAQAAQGKKQRVIFAIPLLSILEQNAAVIREFLGDSSAILEHHSNVVRERNAYDELDPVELMQESWQAPVIITTMVQLLDTLFAGRTSCIRRMHALQDSVIVMDEVQSVPRHLLSGYNLALNYLSGVCGATVVLCSATQPCLEYAKHPLRYAWRPELVPEEDTWRQVFGRTTILDRRRASGYTIEELADFAIECGNREGSLLLICNTKAQARELFETVERRWNGCLAHLSTSMCMDHRRRVLGKVCQALTERRPVMLISTQVVEAGVDISFGCVIRVLAGMENVVQAAGRCNRHGEYGERRPVYIVNIRGENLSRLPDIRQAQQAAASLLLQFERQPEAFGADITGPAAIQAYYRALYAEMDPDAQDNPLPAYGTTWLDLLTCNRQFRARCSTAGRYTLVQAFRTAGEAFRVFDDATTDVLVPHEEGKTCIAELSSQRARCDAAYRESWIRRGAAFSVALYTHQLKKLGEIGGIQDIFGDGSVLALLPGCYDEQTGVRIEGDADIFQEV